MTVIENKQPGNRDAYRIMVMLDAPYFDEIADACKKAFRIDWSEGQMPKPAFTGVRELRDFPLAEIVPYIDWSPFFMAWELAGK